MFKFIDLFAGIGGFHYGLGRLGGKCVLTCEMDSKCRRVYERAHGYQKKFIENIRSITRTDPDDESALRSIEEIDDIVPDHDVLCGGFPCQPFSLAGKLEGFKDKTRGTLFLDILQILEAKKPKYVFLENVRNLGGSQFRDIWDTIISSLRQLGYEVSPEPLIFSPHLLPPTLGGTPQIRQRVFILGIRNDQSAEPLKDIINLAKVCERELIWDPEKWDARKILVPDAEIPDVEKYYASAKEYTYIDAWTWFIKNFPSDFMPRFRMRAYAMKRGARAPDGAALDVRTDFQKNSDLYVDNKDFVDHWKSIPWGKDKILVDDFPPYRQRFDWNCHEHHPTKAKRTLDDLIMHLRQSGPRVTAPKWFPTLTVCTPAILVGPALREGATKFRKLIPTEVARLQGFPDRIHIGDIVKRTETYRQLGNAVCTGLIQTVASFLIGHPSTDALKVNVRRLADRDQQILNF